MSRRVFYIVHLDKARIATLSFLASGMLLIAFATGYRIARSSNADTASIVSMNDPMNDPIRSSFQNDMMHRSVDSNPDPIDSDLKSSDQDSKTEIKDTDRKSKPDTDQDATETTSKTTTIRDSKEPPQRQRINLLDAATDPENDQDNRTDNQADRLPKKSLQPAKTEPVKKEAIRKPTKAKETVRKDAVKPQNKKPVTSKKTEPEKRKTIEKKNNSIDAPTAKPSVYVLQMGAFQSREAALRLSDQLRSHGVSTYVRKTGKTHTVRTDGTTDRQALSNLEKKLKSLHFSPITVMIQDK